MLKINRPFAIWLVLTCVIFVSAVLPGKSWIYLSIAGIESSRWAHFLAYMLAVSIPVTVLRQRRDVFLSLLPALINIALEYLQWYIYGPFVRPRNLSADLFGVAAGILLGLNMRVMRNSTKPAVNDGNSDHSLSTRD